MSNSINSEAYNLSFAMNKKELVIRFQVLPHKYVTSHLQNKKFKTNDNIRGGKLSQW
jgi:hypothetical protein